MSRCEPTTATGTERDRPGVYLVSFAGLWLYALPEYLDADNGLTGRGTPIGSLPYALGCFVVAIALLVAVYFRPAGSPVSRHRALVEKTLERAT